MARLRRLQIHYERVFSEVLPSRMVAAWSFPAISLSTRVEPADGRVDTAAEWVVTLEIAGLREDEYEVLLYPDYLVVQGDRPWRQLGRRRGSSGRISRHGPFHAAVHIPWRAGSIDVDRIRVEYQDGLLRIRVPKTKAQEGWR